MSDAAPLMNSRTRPPADTWRLNAKKTCSNTVTSRQAPKKMAATVIEMPGHATIAAPIAMASSPDTRADFHRCGNRLGMAGADGVVMKGSVARQPLGAAQFTALPFRTARIVDRR